MRGGNTKRVSVALSVAAICFMSRGAQASDFFNLSATGTTTTVSANGSNVLNLADELIQRDSQFASLSGQAVTGSLRFGTLNHAINFTENAGGTSATLTIPSTGFTRTFTAANSAALDTQIRNFLKTDGANAYADLIKVVDRTSPVAATDGNPLSSTAVIADDPFNRFGLRPLPPSGSSEFRVESDGGVDRAGGINGNFADLDFSGNWALTANIGLSLGTDLQYLNQGGSTSYTVAEVLALPVVVMEQPHDTFYWEVTPWGFGGLAASYDEAAGTVLVGGGLTSSVGFRAGDFTFAVADQGSYGTDVGVTVDGYDFHVPVNQWILKNGASVSWRPGNGPISFDGAGSVTNFLQDAAVPLYYTGEAGIAYHFSPHWSIRASYVGDFAPHYTVTGGELELLARF